MNKNEFVEQVIKALQADYEVSLSAVNEAAETATHEENVARSKYETKAVEAAYLVEGQLRRNAELEQEIAAFRNMRVREFNNKSRVLLSALVELESSDGSVQDVFMGPQGGGRQILGVTIVTPLSPLGKAILGKSVGDDISVLIDSKDAIYKLRKLS
jgi:transcription elongation GreA/GreB family factor